MAEAAGEDVNKVTDHTILLSRYIECAEHLIQKCRELGDIPGAGKLERKCAAELKYLRSLSRRRGGYAITHLRSSNLGHYVGALHAAHNLPQVTHILQAFSCPGRTEPLHIDVVAGRGHIWVKVIARKAQALHLVWAGQGQYGERDIVLQATDFVVCSKAHPVNFVDPKVMFSFYNGVTAPISDRLERCGVKVLGEVVPVDASIEEKLSNVCFDDSDSDNQNISSDNENTSSEESVIVDDIESQNAENEKYFGKANQLTLERNVRTTAPNKLSENLVTDSFTINKNGSKTRDQCVSLQLSGNERSNQRSIDQDKFEIDVPKQIDNGKLWSPNHTSVADGNLVVSNSDSMSEVLPCPKKQYQIKTDLQNISEKNTDCNLGKWNFGSISLLSFIRTELLLNCILDFSILGRIVSDNEINNIDTIGKVNLDITALITLVSAVSHGGCNFRFREKILSEQAEEERRDPVLPKLHAFINGKQWYACQTAVESFNSILETLGGEQEKKRASDLLAKLTVVPDNPSFRASAIPNTGKIKVRSKIIFGTGDSLRAVTVTANSGFVRAAEHQGVTFAVFLHASRALTEQKEISAEKLKTDY